MKKFLILLSLIILAAPKLFGGSGAKIGNGGYGIVINDRIFSLDLAMRDVHLDHYLSFDETINLSSDEQAVIDYHLEKFANTEIRGIVVRKLSELKRRLQDVGITGSQVTVPNLVQGMDKYRWILVRDLSCTDVGDDQSPFRNKIQLAYRNGMWIRFCSDITKIDAANMASLLLHEIIYAQLADDKQPLVPALVGFLFSQDFRNFDERGRSEFKHLIEQMAPSPPPKNEPKTTYALIVEKMKDAAMPSTQQILENAAWMGQCASSWDQNNLEAAALFFFYAFDPVLGKKLQAALVTKMVGAWLGFKSIDKLSVHEWQLAFLEYKGWQSSLPIMDLDSASWPGSNYQVSTLRQGKNEVGKTVLYYRHHSNIVDGSYICYFDKKKLGS